MSTPESAVADHIPVVDDDWETRNLLGRFPSKHGYRVTEAGDGKEMRRALRDCQIDLVTLDLMHPYPISRRWSKGEKLL